MWRTLLGIVAIFLLALLQISLATRCYTCANDFIVWNWRHLFLKRNYGMSSSDNQCVHADYYPDTSKECISTCFIVYLNGTDRNTGQHVLLGVGRGCSGQFLSDEQYSSRALGIQSKPSSVSQYLSHDFDALDIWEHWCFCATEYCNTQNCFAQWTFGQVGSHSWMDDEHDSYNYISRRRPSSSSSISSYWGLYGNTGLSYKQERGFLSYKLVLTVFLVIVTKVLR